ncbi:MAG: MCD, Malonyl-CoA decarboxylase MCD [Alphaproteobacteria bacterium]|nr:MCD, Malonyl-CoA decarboxylase MCD [Alphaproteobacteria bacterium]
MADTKTLSRRALPNVGFLRDLVRNVTARGRELLPWPGRDDEDGRVPEPGALAALCQRLLAARGEVSSLTIAGELAAAYRRLDDAGRIAFLRLMATGFDADAAAVREAFVAYDRAPTATTLHALARAAESSRQELFRRLNQVAGGTATIVQMRADLLRHLAVIEGGAAVDGDLAHLLASWFNRGFLVLQRIDWSSPAAILEKIIRYEAVHAIESWDDLRRRLAPVDRRCFAFFHPALVDEPLIFVEVALTDSVPGSIQALLASEREAIDPQRATTAVFYSISNCQPGLRGISFGNFLIKQVVDDLRRDLPRLSTFVTLSPLPGFRRWLEGDATKVPTSALGEAAQRMREALVQHDWATLPATQRGDQSLRALAAAYLLVGKDAKGRTIDRVARFHLGNGASVHDVHAMADVTAKGLRESAGVMVNYRYDLEAIEANHEAFAEHGTVSASNAVRRLAKDFI